MEPAEPSSQVSLSVGSRGVGVYIDKQKKAFFYFDLSCLLHQTAVQVALGGD